MHAYMHNGLEDTHHLVAILLLKKDNNFEAVICENE